MRFPSSASAESGAFSSRAGAPCTYRGDGATESSALQVGAHAGVRKGLADAWDLEATARFTRVFDAGSVDCDGSEWSFSESSIGVSTWALQALFAHRPFGLASSWRIEIGSRVALDSVGGKATASGDPGDEAEYSSRDIWLGIPLGTGFHLGSNETFTIDLLGTAGYYVTGDDDPALTGFLHLLALELQLGLAF